MRREDGGRISFSHSSRLKGYTVSVQCSVSTLLSSLITHHPPTETFGPMTPRDRQVYCSKISKLYVLEWNKLLSVFRSKPHLFIVTALLAVFPYKCPRHFVDVCLYSVKCIVQCRVQVLTAPQDFCHKVVGVEYLTSRWARCKPVPTRHSNRAGFGRFE